MVYLDASAFVKAVRQEPESEALKRELDPETCTASALLLVEGTRGCARHGDQDRRRAAEWLGSMPLVAIDDTVLRAAADVPPKNLGSGDAIHLATALSLGTDIEAFYCYDERLADAARAAGLSVRSPR